MLALQDVIKNNSPRLRQC